MKGSEKYKASAPKSDSQHTEYVCHVVNYKEENWLGFYDEIIRKALENSFSKIDNLKSIGLVPNMVIWSFCRRKLLPFTFPYINFGKKPSVQLDKAMQDIARGLEKFSFTELMVENEFTVRFHFKQAEMDEYWRLDSINDEIVITIGSHITEEIAEQDRLQLRTFVDYFSECLRTWRGENIHDLKDRKEFLDDLHETFFWGISNIFRTEEISDIYFVPIVLADKKRGKNVVGMLALNAQGAIENSDIDNIIVPIVTGIISPYHVQEYEFLWRNAVSQAAAAAILARNMSHNIGSHVMPRANMGSIRRRLQELYETASGNWLDGDDVFNMVRTLKDCVDDYIRQKADFLAEIPTEPISSFSSAYFYRDVILPFITNPILMDCLAANEGARYRAWEDCALSIRFFTRAEDASRHEIRATIDGDPKENPQKAPETDQPGKGFMAPYGLRSLSDLSQEISLRITGEEEDVAIALPGTLGQFAVYGILENLIRNAAKHNRGKMSDIEGAGLTITLHVIEDPDDTDCYRLLIYDNVTDPRKPTGSGENIKDLHEKLQGILDAPITDERGKVRQEAWGLAEMVICGNLLVGSDSFTNENDIVKAYPGTEADLGEAAGSSERLVYEFRVPKARQALFAGKGLAKALCLDEVGEKEWIRAGIVIKRDADELHDFLIQSGAGTAAFQFVVIEETVQSELDERPDNDERDWRQRLPFRIIRVNTEKGPGRVDDDTGNLVVGEKVFSDKKWSPKDSATLMYRLWAVWCRRWLDLSRGEADDGQSPAGLVSVYLDNIGSDDFEGRWKEAMNSFNEMAVSAETGPSRISLRVTTTANPQEEGDSKSSSQKVRAVIFDRHGGGVSGIRMDKQHRAYIPFDKTTADFINIFQPKFPYRKGEDHTEIVEPWTFPYELFEAGMLRVLVLDERIAERAMTPVSAQDDTTLGKTPEMLLDSAYADATPCMWHVAYGARVLIATHLICRDEDDPIRGPKEGALHGSSYAACHDKYWAGRQSDRPPTCPMLAVDIREGFNLRIHRIEPEAGKNEEDRLGRKDIDVIVVHQGILDTFQEFCGGDNGLLDRLKEACPWVIVESGRGMPPELQKNNEKFLSFSAMDRCFGEARIAKLMLCKILMERTRTRRESV